jgi:hypothetical protein|tara:strand:+ start:7895 stop:8329 length:435 start_codon:yes stop_codon:yes gene_type:complete
MKQRRNEAMTSNPVWKRYVAENVEKWLTWLKNVHLPSYVDLTQRFINLNPAYRPPPESLHDEQDLLRQMLWNEEFIMTLSDKGLLVWANGTVADLVDELRNYQSIKEIKIICDFLDSNLLWFERVYAFTRADIISYLRSKGKSI